MKLSDLRIMARALIPGSKVGSIKNPLLDAILNAGVLDIATHTACLKTNKKFTVTAEDYDYSLSSVLGDYLVMDRPGIYWNAGTAAAPDWQQLDPRTLKYFDRHSSDWRDDDSDDPLEYSIDGDVLTLRPTPDTTLANGLWIYYGKRPTPMTAPGHYSFSGSTTEYTHLSVFDDVILAYWEWKAQKILNKGQDQYKLKETAYRAIREEKFSLFKRRPDISFHRDAKLQGRKLRS